MFLCAARTGLRLGEVLALRWEDVDVNGRFILAELHTLEADDVEKREIRRVDYVLELTRVLKTLLLERQMETAMASTEFLPWVPEPGGELLHTHNLGRRGFQGLLNKAGLRQIRFHDLRHTSPHSSSSREKARSTSKSRRGTLRYRSRSISTAI